MRTARDGVGALRQALRAHGGIVAGVLAEPHMNGARLDRPGPAQIAAAGPRTRGQELEYELLLEMILEGYRLHYDEPLVVHPGDDDLALLLGDQLYAVGLTRLAALGDLDAVAELADVISLVAQAQAGGDRELAEAIWEAGAACIGWGSSDAHERAKDLAREHDPGAAPALRAAASSAVT